MSINWASTPTGTCMTSSRICRRCYGVRARACEPLLRGPLRRRRARAVGCDPSALLKPTADSWPTYHGDYSGQRHSRLTQITPANVHQLTLAWAFQTNQTQQIKATPILVNGVIYITTPDNLWAIDARSARQIWRYTYPPNDGFHIGHRGVAVYKDLVYMTTPDAHLVALDARDGKVRWNVEIADSQTRLLVHQRAAHHPQSSARRRVGRLRQPARHPEVVRRRDRQAPMDVLQHAAARHARLA